MRAAERMILIYIKIFVHIIMKNFILQKIS